MTRIARPVFRILPLILCACSLLAAASTNNKLGEHPKVADAIKVLDAWIGATVDTRDQPGLSVGIIHDQDLIWAKGYGYADREKKTPATPSTLYRIASISKLFTSTAILQLRDAGKLQLDDPVAKYLPWFKIQTPHPGPAITIRHLLTHTSGLPREAVGVNWSDLTFPAREEMIRRLADQETVWPAETEWKYSNLALSLAGEIVSAVSGEPWSQYVEKHILTPLGMTSTRTLPNPDLPNLATGYGRRVRGERDVEPFVDIEAERPAGNLASNVADLAKFLALQFRDGEAGGAQILKGATLREMHRVHWLRDDWKSGWGLGFSVRRVGEQTRVGHGGSLPGHRTQVELAHDIKLGVIVLTNANDGDPLRYVDQAFKLLTPAVTHAVEEAKPESKPDSAWKKYEGIYTWKHSDIQIAVLDGELTMISPESESAWESRVKLEPAGPDRFKMVAKTGYGAGGEQIRFEIDAEGRVTRVSTANNYWLPKPPE